MVRHVNFIFCVKRDLLGALMLSCTAALANTTDSLCQLPAPKLVASSAQAGVGAQNAAQAAARSTAASAASSTPTAPEVVPTQTAVPSWSAPASTATVSPSFSGPSSSSSSTAPPVQLRELIRTSVTPEPQDNSVESFFQVPKRPAPTPTNAALDHKKKFLNSTGRALWHVLDNIGVPMFFGDNDLDLDPRLSRDYVNPALPSLDKSAARVINQPSSVTTVPAAINTQPPHKIPEGELEGTEINPASDGQTKTTP